VGLPIAAFRILRPFMWRTRENFGKNSCLCGAVTASNVIEKSRTDQARIGAFEVMSFAHISHRMRFDLIRTGSTAND
jgi:hypothetical protein